MALGARRLDAHPLSVNAFASAHFVTRPLAYPSAFSRVPSDQASALILGGAAVLLWIVAVPVDLAAGVRWLASPTAWVAVAVAGLIGAAFAKVFLLRAVRRVGGTRTSVLLLSEPIVGSVLAALLLGQGVAPLQVLGGLGVLVGAGLAQRPARGLVPSRS
jgi:drug/metabolite transporter (DMT)-like permease